VDVWLHPSVTRRKSSGTVIPIASNLMEKNRRGARDDEVSSVIELQKDKMTFWRNREVRASLRKNL
jgi:hypothetical protein